MHDRRHKHTHTNMANMMMLQSCAKFSIKYTTYSQHIVPQGGEGEGSWALVFTLKGSAMTEMTALSSTSPEWKANNEQFTKSMRCGCLFRPKTRQIREQTHTNTCTHVLYALIKAVFISFRDSKSNMNWKQAARIVEVQRGPIKIKWLTIAFDIQYICVCTVRLEALQSMICAFVWHAAYEQYRNISMLLIRRVP